MLNPGVGVSLIPLCARQQMLADPSEEAPPSPHAEPASSLSCGLDRLMLDVDGRNGGNKAPSAQTGSTDPVQVAKIDPDPARVVATPPVSQGTAALEAAAAAAAATTAPPIRFPEKPKPRGTLLVSSTAASKTPAAAAGAAPVPVVTLSSKSPPSRTRKAGPKKAGARKLGAMKLGGGGAVQLSGFSELPAESGPAAAADSEKKRADDEAADLQLARKLQQEEDAAAAAAAPSARLAAAAASALATPAPPAKTNGLSSSSGAGSIYRSVNDSSGGYGYRGGGSSSTGAGASGLGSSSYSSYGSGGSGYGGGSSAFDKDKYKNAKGIGSDMLFAGRDDDPAEQARRAMKVAEYSGSSAISSDMYFDRETESANADGSGAGMGLGGMAEQIAMTAATEFQGASQAATKLKASAWTVRGVCERKPVVIVDGHLLLCTLAGRKGLLGGKCGGKYFYGFRGPC